MAMVRKKQDDKYLEALRELITTGGGNRQCFDCGQKGPTYVNMTIGSFVCTRCSGVLRGLTPPHRVKSISMATFTQEEIDFLKAHGNDVCAKTWLGLWDPKRAVHQDQRELMIDKYERKRYFLEPASPLKSLTNATNLKSSGSAAAAAASTSSSSSSSSSSNMNSNNNRSNNSSNNNNSTQIQLTPPTSQRTTANGLHKSSSSAISRPHHSTPQQNGFISSSSSSSHTDAFGLHNGLNTSVGSASTGALSDTSSCASANGFGAEADFVADFGSADIFNATVASSPASSIGSASTNGYAKIQPLKAAAHHQQFMNNGHGGSIANNGNGLLVNGNSNNGFGSSPATNGNTENFADFDHAPIYNAAEEANYQFVRKNAIRKKSLRSGSLTLKPNERQLKDILEMDNPLDDVIPQKAQQDYIEFTTDDVYKQRNSADFNNIVEDFEQFLTFKQNEAKHQQQLQQQHQQQKLSSFEGSGISGQKQFTPLALAAHATAMAVLGNSNHFNTHLTTNSHAIANDKSLISQWDVWSADSNATTNQETSTSTVGMSTTPWQTTPFGAQQQHQQYQQQQYQQQSHQLQLQQQQQQQHQLYGSLSNCMTGNLALDYPQQHNRQQHQQLSSSSYNAYSDTNLFSTTSVFDTAAPTVATVAAAATSSSSSVAVPPTSSVPFGTLAAANSASATSLPMSNGGINSHKNSTANGFNNNNNNSSASTPAEDRYAALKDLDEQLRESKAVAAHAASIVTANVVDSGFGNPNNGTVNPFATHAAVANPFQNTNQTTPQNTTQLFGQMTLIPNGIAAANGFLNAQKAQPNAGFFNYTANGFTNAAVNNTNAMYPATMPTTAGPNGCGFGFGTLQQQITATGTGLTANTFNNPFAASGALNSNNPFL